MLLTLAALLVVVAPRTALTPPPLVERPRAACYDLVRDCGGGAQKDQEFPSVDDSPSFVKCQEKASRDGGGCIFVPAGM